MLKKWDVSDYTLVKQLSETPLRAKWYPASTWDFTSGTLSDLCDGCLPISLCFAARWSAVYKHVKHMHKVSTSSCVIKFKDTADDLTCPKNFKGITVTNNPEGNCK